jgi:hypothetical protein
MREKEAQEQENIRNRNYEKAGEKAAELSKLLYDEENSEKIPMEVELNNNNNNNHNNHTSLVSENSNKISVNIKREKLLELEEENQENRKIKENSQKFQKSNMLEILQKNSSAAVATNTNENFKKGIEITIRL